MTNRVNFSVDNPITGTEMTAVGGDEKTDGPAPQVFSRQPTLERVFAPPVQLDDPNADEEGDGADADDLVDADMMSEAETIMDGTRRELEDLQVCARLSLITSLAFALQDSVLLSPTRVTTSSSRCTPPASLVPRACTT